MLVIVIMFLAFTSICDALCDLVLIVKFQKRENTRGGVLLLLKLHTKNMQLYYK